MPKRTFAAEACRRRHSSLISFWIRRPFLLFAAVVIGGLCFAKFAAHAQTADGQTRLLRTPTISATQIAFAYANNIWTVPRSGGSARRLTSFQGQTGNPHFSPDGKWIAFSGEYVQSSVGAQCRSRFKVSLLRSWGWFAIAVPINILLLRS